jgi:hypothetical protein
MSINDCLSEQTSLLVSVVYTYEHSKTIVQTIGQSFGIARKMKRRSEDTSLGSANPSLRKAQSLYLRQSIISRTATSNSHAVVDEEDAKRGRLNNSEMECYGKRCGVHGIVAHWQLHSTMHDKITAKVSKISQFHKIVLEDAWYLRLKAVAPNATRLFLLLE